MAYTANDYQKLVEDFMKSPEGRKFLKEQKNVNVGYTDAEMKKIAENLKRDIIAAFLLVVKEPGAQFEDNLVSVHFTDLGIGPQRKAVRILFHDRALSRYSLWDYKRNSAPREGVFDIIGLFTQGYSANNYAYGSWIRHDGDDFVEDDSSYIRSLKSRMANDFINKVIGKYKVLYPDIEIKYPRRWGGTEPDNYEN